MTSQPRIVIVGAGPTGLGAGYRLQELGYGDWVILEANDYVGGLATSFTDQAGFTYDIGGHVMFSHYPYYDELVDKLMASVDPVAKVVRTTDGRTWPYDVLPSTMPLNRLVGAMESVPDAVRRAAGGLHWSGSHIVGVGVDRPAHSSKNWIYFPEPDVPFYRVTYLSNYSPYVTPEPDQTLFLTETSRSPHKPEDPATIVERVVDGLVATGLMHESDRELVVTTWLCSPDMTYPVPSLTRDASLGVIQPWLRSQGIWSRGRFGAWLYEIGNMDHSAMQGVEFVDHVLAGEPETVWIARGE